MESRKPRQQGQIVTRRLKTKQRRSYGQDRTMQKKNLNRKRMLGKQTYPVATPTREPRLTKEKNTRRLYMEEAIKIGSDNIYILKYISYK